MKQVWFLIITVIFLFFSINIISADNTLPIINPNQFITIVNPVRISAYNTDPEKSLAAEYEQINKFNLPATWLLTYDAIDTPNITSLTKRMDGLQEIGILLEISPKFSNDTKIIYKETDSWHRAKALFLSGYKQQERIIFIDFVFNKFKSVYGYYPKSVGAWWIDSFSLDYMQKKYGITSSLSCSDQFFTDSYSIWGQFWSTPFYPSRYHTGIPATTIATKLDLVILQWAPRDPLNAYGPNKASTYSTQDYHTNNLPIEYYEKLIRLYTQNLRNKFGQVTLGLEADLSESTYQEIFAKHLSLINKLKEKENFKITTMKTFSDWYRNTFPTLSPSQVIEHNDLLGSKTKVIWYQSPNYRIGLTYNPDNLETNIFDFRIFFNNFQEPFYSQTNDQMDLFINVPSIIDTINNPQNNWNIKAGQLLSIDGNSDNLILSYQDKRSINFTPTSFIIHNINLNFSHILNNSKLTVKTSDHSIKIIPNLMWSFNVDGMTIQNFPVTFLYIFNINNLLKPKVLSIVFLTIIFCLLIIVKFKLLDKKNINLFLKSIFILVIIFAVLSKINTYYINQEEIEALYHLQTLPEGKVLVYDNYCLKCSWNSKFEPAAFANLRDYISQISKKPLIYNRTFFTSITPDESRNFLRSTGARYIYLVKSEKYIEKLPFNENEYNIEKKYENANAQIWEIQ